MSSIGSRDLVPSFKLDKYHFAVLELQPDLSVLELQGILPEQLPPPAMHRRHVGIVISRDILQIIAGCHKALGNALFLGTEL